MERIKERPRSGYSTLFLLDEFAGVKRMELIENAVARARGLLGINDNINHPAYHKCPTRPPFE